jgi:hypothetical protein
VAAWRQLPPVTASNLHEIFCQKERRDIVVASPVSQCWSQCRERADLFSREHANRTVHGAFYSRSATSNACTASRSGASRIAEMTLEWSHPTILAIRE